MEAAKVASINTKDSKTPAAKCAMTMSAACSININGWGSQRVHMVGVARDMDCDDHYQMIKQH